MKLPRIPDPPAAILLDLDGTLVHSAPDLAAAVNLTLRELGLDDYSEQTITGWIGDGAVRLLKRAVTGELYGEPEAEHFARVFEHFRDNYQRRLCVDSHLYPGVREGLDELHGASVRLACVTNKSARFTGPLLEQLGIANCFRVAVSGDTLATKKPHPAPLRHACDELGVDATQAVMVGDSFNDIESARRAGMASVWVEYGYGRQADLTECPPRAIIREFSELLPLIRY